ncbi:MAG: CHASE2 domain-containing protein [Desulfatitalea sp.]|nr:adenylate/guanylate cyclase domain-containing protein [Desulfatitalea sp.]NNJ99159.1 CHASE2 domain-containing protein [Desulfatitalea sp.]
MPKKVFVVATAVFGVMVLLGHTGILFPLQMDFYDLKVRFWRQQRAMPDELALVLIDEASLAAMAPLMGRWPWPREVFADLLDYFKIGGASAVVFDILFVESSTAGQEGENEHDRRLAAASRSADNVIYAAQAVREADESLKYYSTKNNVTFLNKYKKEKIVIALDGWRRPDHPVVYWPTQPLALAATGIGMASFVPDVDGVYRRAEPLFRSQSRLWPALSLAALLYIQEDAVLRLTGDALDFETVAYQRTIPLAGDQTYWVSPYGRYTAYSLSGLYLSLMRLKQGRVDTLPVHPEVFRDKVVFIGASAAGVEDLKSTSLNRLTPGVLLHAAVCANIMDGDMRRPSPRWVDLGLLGVAVFFTSIVIFSCGRTRSQIICWFSVVVLLCAVDLAVYPLGWIVSAIPAVIAVSAVYLSAMTWLNFSTSREKRKIRNILGQYVAPNVLTTVLDQHKEDFLSAEVGRRRTLTLQFSDIRQFTTIVEQLSVEQSVNLLNRYLAMMVEVIFAHYGTLDKFIGDAILAFWGAPIDDEDHAFHAVACAVQMQHMLSQLNHEFSTDGLPRLSMGIGVHTDEVILGNIGSSKKLDYTVIGDGVNFTSRLESLTKVYQCPVLVSKDTYEAVKSRICCRAVDYVQVKGKSRCVRIYEAMELASHCEDRLLAVARKSDAAYALYMKHRFAEAADLYREVLQLKPDDGLSHLFIDRCNRYDRHPPGPDWKGECVFERK